MLLSQNAPAVGHWRGILKKNLLLFQSSILRDRGHGRTADPAQVNIKGFISWLVSAVNKHCCVLCAQRLPDVRTDSEERRGHLLELNIHTIGCFTAADTSENNESPASQDLGETIE